MKQKQFINPSNHLFLSAGLKLRPCQGFCFLTVQRYGISANCATVCAKIVFCPYFFG